MHKKNINAEVTNLSKYIHQAVLEPHTNIEELNQLCDASDFFDFKGFCTNLVRIPLARNRISTKKSMNLIAVIGFPFGDIPEELKQAQAEWAAEQGADEIDVVPNFLNLHEGNGSSFSNELSKICELGLPTRAILDTTRLNMEKLEIAVEASIDAGVKGIQTGNGFGPKATPKTIERLLPLVRGRCSIKAAGGVTNLIQALDLIKSGCSEIGTSKGLELIKEFKALNQ